MAEKQDITEVLARRIQQAIETDDLAELRDCLNHRDFREINFLDWDEDTNRRLIKPLTVYTAEKGSVEALQILLEHGCDPNAFDSLGNTPLLIAVAQERLAMIRFLLAHPAVHVDAVNNYGEDIYSIALLNQNKEILACVETIPEALPIDPQSAHFRFSPEGTQDVFGCC